MHMYTHKHTHTYIHKLTLKCTVQHHENFAVQYDVGIFIMISPIIHHCLQNSHSRGAIIICFSGDQCLWEEVRGKKRSLIVPALFSHS